VPRCRIPLDALTQHGYVVATVHYRTPDQHLYPAAIEDLKVAVRWLRAHAEQYGLDVERIGAAGLSAGGYGACMLGTTGPGDGFEGTSENSDYSSRVQAVVALGAPADFRIINWTPEWEKKYLQPFFGVSYPENSGLYARASPGTYATPDAPPFLLFHSSEDLTVPVEMGWSFVKQLRQAHVSVEWVEKKGCEHIWAGTKLDSAVEQMVQFFDRHLRPS
jgi:acetyl esterase/lipase